MAVSTLMVTSAIVLLPGCGSKSSEERPVVVLITDVSGSTSDLRVSGGEFSKAVNQTIIDTAQAEGQLWARPVAGQAAAKGTWVIQGDGADAAGDFEKGSGGDEYEQTRLKNRALALAASPSGKELLKTIPRTAGAKSCGSDLLGAIKEAEKIFSDFPDQPKALVILTDGGVCSRGVDLASNPPSSPGAQAALVKKLQSRGEVSPEALSGVEVWAGGVGRGLTGNDGRDATAVTSLWNSIVEAAGGEVGDIDTSLNLTGFPPG